MTATLIRYVLSVLLCSFFITVSATQLVLSNLTNFDLPAVSFAQRIDATIHDLINFGPTIMMIVALAYLIGFLLVWLLSKWWLNQSIWGFLAGLTSVPAAVALVNAIVGIDLLYITIHPTGWFILLMGSVLGSMLFYRNVVNEDN